MSLGGLVGSIAGMAGVGKVVGTSAFGGLSQIRTTPVPSISSIIGTGGGGITGTVAGLPGVGAAIAQVPSIASIQGVSVPTVAISKVTAIPSVQVMPIKAIAGISEIKTVTILATGSVSAVLPVSQVVQVAPSVVQAMTYQVTPSKIKLAAEVTPVSVAPITKEVVPTKAVTTTVQPTPLAATLISRTPELKPIDVSKLVTPSYKLTEVTPSVQVITPSQAAAQITTYESPASQMEPYNLAMAVALRARTPELQYTTSGMLLAVSGLNLPKDVVASGDVTQIQNAIESTYAANPTLKTESISLLTAIAGPEGAHKLVIQSALTNQLGVAGLREERTIGDMLREDLNKHPEWGLSNEQTEDLINYYPEMGLSLLADPDSVDDVKLFFQYRDDLRKQGSDMGWTDEDDKERISGLIAATKIAGGSEEMAQSLVTEYYNQLNAASKYKIGDWFSSGDLINRVNDDVSRFKPGESIGTWMQDPTNQLYLTAGTITLGGIGGLALKGIGGMVAGAVTGVFAGTEIPNLSNSNIFASNTLQKLQAAGIKDAAQTIGGYKTEYNDITKNYNDALARGDLAGADKYASQLQELGNRYANYVDTNWAAFEKVGMLDDTRTAIINQYDTATQNRFTTGVPSYTSGEMKVEGFDPKTDQLMVNGVLLKNYDGSNLRLPPGEYKVDWKRSGYEFNGFLVGVTKNGGVTSSTIKDLPSSKQQELAAKDKQITTIQDPNTLAQKTTTVEKEAAYSAGVKYNITWQPGWQVQDPYTLEWKKAGDINIYGAGATTVIFKDPDGNLRYSRITNNDPSQSSFITGLDALPFQPILQVPYQAKTPTGKGYIMFDNVRKPGYHYYVDGIQVTENAVGMSVQPGDHSLVIEAEGMKPTEVKFTVTDGESNYITFAHVMIPEPQEQGGGGGGGEGGMQFGAAEVQTTITFGTSLAGARIWLDDVEIQPVIGQAYSTTTGYHAVKATKTGYENWSKVVYCSEKQNLEVNAIFVLSSTSVPIEDGTSQPKSPTPGKAYVKFESTVIGAQVYINDTLLEVIVGTPYAYDFGYYGIKITKPDKVDWIKNVYLATGDTLTISPIFEDIVEVVPVTPVTPTETTKRVFINTTPTGSKILINDGFTGEWTPGYLDLEKGIYKLVTTKSGYVDKTSYVYVGDTIAFGDTALSLARLAGLVIPT